MQFTSLDDVLEEQLGDLYDAERQLVGALPKMREAAGDPELRKAFQTHLEQTKNHVERLEQVFTDLELSTPSETCKGMEGLIAEGKEVIEASGDEAAKDAALIAAAQRVEHYEIAGYGTVRTLAQEFGHTEAAKLLDQTLQEEGKADELLTQIAAGGARSAGVNRAAAKR